MIIRGESVFGGALRGGRCVEEHRGGWCVGAEGCG